MNIKSLKLPSYGNQIKLTGADGKKNFQGELLFDLNHDGQISAGERTASKRLAHDKKFLNQLDRNHDGKVDTNELKRAGAKVATVNWGCFGGRSESIQDVDHVNVDPYGRNGSGSGYSVVDFLDVKSGEATSHWQPYSPKIFQ